MSEVPRSRVYLDVQECVDVFESEGYLAHKKPPAPRTLP